MKRIAKHVFLVLLAAVGADSRADTLVSDTSFTYQGLLEQTGVGVTDLCDFQFGLWTGNNAPDVGVQVGTDLQLTAAVDEGIFSAELDFGANALDGSARWLNIEVCCPSGCAPAYTELVPRQAITSSPYSIQTRGIFVDQSGNVGIGTTSPNAQLTVGDGDGADFQVGQAPQLYLAKDAADDKFRIQLAGSGYAGNVLQIGRDDAGHDVVLSGDIGIGTETPTAMLTIGEGDEAEMQLGQSPQLGISKDTGDGKFRMQLTGPGYSNNTLQIGRDDATHGIRLSGDVNAANDVNVVGDLNVEGVLGVLDAATIVGSVGIGANPGLYSKLNVNAANNSYGVLVQTGIAEVSSIGLHTNATGYSSLAKNAYYDGGWQRFDTGSGAYLQEVEPDGDTTFNAAPAGGNPIDWNRAMVIKPSGRIGMGTNDPDKQLHVNGSVIVEGTLDIGLELVHGETYFSAIFLSCPSGKVVIGGGCDCNNNEDVQASSPFFVNGLEQWLCHCTGDADEDPHTGYAFCARVERTGIGPP